MEREEEEEENRSFPVALFSLQDSSIGTLSGECKYVSKGKKREKEKEREVFLFCGLFSS